MSKRRSSIAGSVLIGALFVVACNQMTSPTSPSLNTSPLASPAGRATLSLERIQLTAADASVDFVTDTDENGTAFRLSAFDGVELHGTNNQGAFTAVFDTGTVFRNAHVDRFQPVDPCRDLAVNYNAAGISSDTGLTTAIAELVTGGCVARVLVDKGSDAALPQPPPIKSFRPLPSF
jgi:hypothetical protein